MLAVPLSLPSNWRADFESGRRGDRAAVVIYAARPYQHSGALGKGNEHSSSHSPGRQSVELSISGSNTSRDSLLVSMQGLEARRGSLFYTSISQDLLYLTVEEPQSSPAIHRSYRHNAKMSAFTQRRQIRLTAHPSCVPFSLTLTPSPSPSPSPHNFALPLSIPPQAMSSRGL